MKHTRGKPYHPMTQGKIERWHLLLKSRILLENYYLPGDLERAVADFVDHYNHRRYHESLDNLTPADVYFGRGQHILEMRKEIKRRTIQQRTHSMARIGTFTNGPQLSRNNLRLPFRIKGHGKDCSTLVAKKFEDRDRCP